MLNFPRAGPSKANSTRIELIVWQITRALYKIVQQGLKSFDSVRAGNPRTSHSRVSYDLLIFVQCWNPHPWIAQRRTSQDLPREGSALKDPQYQGPPLQEFREPPVERLTIALRVRCVRKKTLLARSGDDLDDRGPPSLQICKADPAPRDS